MKDIGLSYFLGINLDFSESTVRMNPTSKGTFLSYQKVTVRVIIKRFLRVKAILTLTGPFPSYPGFSDDLVGKKNC